YANVVVPLKFGAGVKRTTPPLSVTEPLAGWVTDTTVSVSPVSGAVLSLASTSSTVALLSSATVKLSAVAVGGLFVPATVTVTVPMALPVPPLPSEPVYANVVGPLKLGAGAKRTTPLVSVAVPLAGWVTAITVSVSPVSGAVLSLASTFTTVSG